LDHQRIDHSLGAPLRTDYETNEQETVPQGAQF